ncbi:unnamed protein product [Diabrotica balteata]|uniref:Uncharacterized protein n=1 Tax=Diabrotica balteata TaxID=107213 RepID=A0A9N9TCZ4_DIABA|nr:unnamed protein product [Diabrotica balteata]
MKNHQMEAFKQNKIKLKAFQEHSYTLGSPAPAVVGKYKEEDKHNNEANAKEQLKLDNSQPTTNLQI